MRPYSDMVSLGRPGVGEEFLAAHGFEPHPRFEVPFRWEFPDPETYARALASTGPAYEAIQDVGEDAFRVAAVELARERQRDGLPLRGEIQLFCYVGTRSR